MPDTTWSGSSPDLGTVLDGATDDLLFRDSSDHSESSEGTVKRIRPNTIVSQLGLTTTTYVNASVAAEAASRASADSAEASTRASADSTEATARIAGDAATAATAASALSSHVGAADPHTGYVLESLVDAKGDLIVGTGDNAIDRLAVGADTKALVADSTSSTGLVWRTKDKAREIYLSPTGSMGETFSRGNGGLINATGGLVSGQLFIYAMPLQTNDTITNISFISGSTAASSPTHWWFGLFDASRVAIRFTADQTTAAWAANTVKTLALTTPYAVTTGALYYVGIMVTATTVPTLAGILNSKNFNLAPNIGEECNTGLTTPPSLPFTASYSAPSSILPYAWST